MATRTIRRQGKRKKEKKEYFFDYTLLFIVFFLLGFGMIMIYSASSYEAFEEYGNAAHYLIKQIQATAVGLFAMFVVAQIPYHFWERFSLLGYAVSVVLILMVKTPLGIESHGARRWIKIPGMPLQLQPAEVAKLCMILFLAVIICKLGSKVRTAKALAILLVLPLPIVGLIVLVTRNLSSAIIVYGIAVVMIFVASPHYKRFFAMAGVLITLAAGYVYLVMNTNILGDFRAKRIEVWFHPESDAKGVGFQTMQGLYAIGSGGIWGKGLGESMQKLNFLPEAQNDMIFSIICEELGLFGGIVVIIMFIMLIWRMMVIANNASDLFGAMLVVGVIGHIAIQAILNIAVVTNSVPNTGISLPFISYGGTSVVFLLIEIGLVLNVAKKIQLKEI